MTTQVMMYKLTNTLTGAALTHAGSKRTHEGNTIQPIRFGGPFIYILRNKITKRIIFIGQILDRRGLRASTSESNTH